MNKEIFYKQCILKKLVKKDTYRILTSWIPEKYAVKDAYLRLKNDDEWEDGWKVISVSDIKKPEKYLVEKERDYKTHRKITDI